GDRGLPQVEDELLDRAEELRARVADPALRLRRDPEHEAQPEPVHAADQPLRIREPMTVEPERADAGLPRVVDQDPPERDLRGAESRDVLEHLRGSVVDVAPLDQRELARRRHGGASGVTLVEGERVREVAGVQILVEARAPHAHLGALVERREGALRLITEAAAAAT